MLRVNAVKELPALSRVGDAGASDREGLSDDRGVANGPGSGCSEVAVGFRRVVIWDPIQIKVPGVCLGGSIVLVESRRVCERRLPTPGRLSSTASLV
jgi:hypothetical protein